MSTREIIIVYSSIIFAIILDSLLSFKLGSVFFDTNFSYLIFSYWVFAAPEKIRVNQSILIGFLVDFLSDSAIGFHISLYCLFSLIIHAYAYTFRLFSYLQLSIFFGTSASFISALFYLFHHPLHYSYLDIFIYWITSMILWFPVYFGMRRFRQKFFYA